MGVLQRIVHGQLNRRCPCSVGGVVGDLTHKTTALATSRYLFSACVIWGSALLLNFMAYYGIPSAETPLLQLATQVALPTSAEPRHSSKRLAQMAMTSSVLVLGRIVTGSATFSGNFTDVSGHTPSPKHIASVVALLLTQPRCPPLTWFNVDGH